MVHPLVTQLRFARREFQRCLDGVSEEDAVRRVMPMNCLSWVVGHMASHEHYVWVQIAQGENIAPGLADKITSGLSATSGSEGSSYELDLVLITDFSKEIGGGLSFTLKW